MNTSETPCQVLLWFPQDTSLISLLSMLLTVLVSGCYNNLGYILAQSSSSQPFLWQNDDVHQCVLPSYNLSKSLSCQ